MLRALLCLALVATTVRAGAECQVKTEKDGETTTMTASTDGKRLVFEDEKMRMVCLGEEMFVEDKVRNVRTRMTKEQLKQLAGMMGGGAARGGGDKGAYEKMKAEFDKALAKMPEGPGKEQARKMMEQRLAPLKPAGDETEVVRRFVEDGDAEVGGKTYAKVSVFEGEKKVAEYFLLPKDEVSALEQFLPAFRQFDSLLSLMPKKSRKDQMPIADFEKLGRMPIVTRRLDGGKVVEESTVSAWKERDVDDAHFAPNPKFREESLGAGFGPR